MGLHFLLQEILPTQALSVSPVPPALADGFFAIELPGKLLSVFLET